MSDSGLKRSFETDTLRRKSVQMEPSALPQPNTNKSSSLGLISSQSSGKVEDFLNKLDIPFIVGDHVLVSGLKEGIVRFIGQADFAKGVWVGVELKKAMGKNDGSVAGKRYFQCPAMHGLFAPVHKVEVCKTPARAPPQPRSRLNLGVSLVSKSHNRGSSIKSATSSASRRMKLGVTSLTGQVRTKGHSAPTLSSYQKKMLKLKEEEDHFTQLIKIQSDLGIPEFIKNEEQFDKMGNKFELIKSEHNRSIADLHSLISQLEEQIRTIEGEKNDIKIQQLEEERKNEDIRFSLEQDKIKMKMRFEELDTEDLINSEYWDENAELMDKLCVAESKLKIYENGQMDHEAGNQIKNFKQKVEKMAVEFASRVKDLEWRAETAENDAEDLRDELKRLKGLIPEISQVKHLTSERELNAKIEKLKNAMPEDKKETASNEESQDVGLMSIDTGASLIEKDFAESLVLKNLHQY